MASLKQFRDDLLAVLATDAELAVWATSWFSRTITVKVDAQAGQLRDDELPAVVIGRARIADPDEPQIGNQQAQKSVNLPLEVVWSEIDARRANDEHCELHDILSRIVLRNRSIGDVAVIGLVEGDAGDTQQPLQAFSAALRAEYRITAA